MGVNQGGTGVVVLQALASLNLRSTLHSVDINPTLPATTNVPNWAPHLIDRWRLYYGKDVSAFLEEIGDGIDFCIMDTAYFMPGEVLNFLCIFPYLQKNATVVIDDQMTHLNKNNEFVKMVGAAWTIACRILFDTDASGKGMLSGIKILSRDDLKRKHKSLNSVIITSPEHSQSIHSLLQETREECQAEFEIINPFNFSLNI